MLRHAAIHGINLINMLGQINPPPLAPSIGLNYERLLTLPSLLVELVPKQANLVREHERPGVESELPGKLPPHEVQVLREPALPCNVRHARKVVDPLPGLQRPGVLLDGGGVDPVDVHRGAGEGGGRLAKEPPGHRGGTGSNHLVPAGVAGEEGYTLLEGGGLFLFLMGGGLVGAGYLLLLAIYERAGAGGFVHDDEGFCDFLYGDDVGSVVFR